MGNLRLWYWGLGGVEHAPCPLNCFLQCSWFGLLDHIVLHEKFQGFHNVNADRAVGVLACEEPVGVDDGVELWPIAIRLLAVGLHEILIFRRVKQKFRLQSLHKFFQRRKLS